jgi:5'-phosphate synthase pdxT subunit
VDESNPTTTPERTPRIGVLAIQGDFDAHATALREAGAEAVLVRKPEQLDDIDGLVIPGGESTTFLKFLERDGFLDRLQTFVRTRPTFGTCAGCILLAKEVTHPSQQSLGVLDATVERNAYGRQIDSVIEEADTKLEGGPMELVYIRAPRIAKTGPSVKVLAERDGFPVLVEEGHILAATFHPELSADRRIHRRFVDLVREHSAVRS